MTVIDVASDERRWPALAAAWYVGAVCAGFGTLVVWSLVHGNTPGDVAVVLLALALRLLTIAMAVAASRGGVASCRRGSCWRGCGLPPPYSSPIPSPRPWSKG